jgi:hypothetical protein
MIRKKSFSIVGIWFLIGLIFFSGCSLINPHVTWVRPTDTANITFADGEKYANDAKDKYKEAIGDQAELNNWLALGLIPLAGAAIGLGVHQVSGQAITALSLTGASGYAIGTWLSSPQRTKIYVAGVKAMGCAVTAMRPLDVGSTFETDLNGLNQAIADTSPAITRLERSINSARGSVTVKLVDVANAELSNAKLLWKDANSTYEVGIALKQEKANAGKNLIQAVDDIGADVDLAISLTLPDLTALPGIINNLSQLSSQFTLPSPSPESAPVSEKEGVSQAMEDPTKKRELESALTDLKEKVRALSIAKLKVASIVTSVNAKQAKEKLKNCGVKPELLVTDITIDPPGTIELAKGGSQGFKAKGGKKPFAASFQDDAKDLTLKQVETFGPAFVIIADKGAESGQHTLYVTDASGHSKFITVKIGKMEPKDGNNGSEQKEKMRKVQVALGFPLEKITCKMDQKTNVELKKFQVNEGLNKKDGTLTKDSEKLLLAKYEALKDGKIAKAAKCP